MTDEHLPAQTTDAGIPVEGDQYSLTVGAGRHPTGLPASWSDW